MGREFVSVFRGIQLMRRLMAGPEHHLRIGIVCYKDDLAQRQLY
jgi:hypothetical protein